MRVGPDLQPITNESMSAATANTADGARLDIAMNGFWGGRFEKSFVDVWSEQRKTIGSPCPPEELL